VGAVLVRDHTRLDAQLLRVAAKVKVSLLQYLTVTQSETGDRLSGELGPLFDHDFTASMMTAHQQMIPATRDESLHGSSAEVEALARLVLPVLEKHLAMLRAVVGSG
jgi:putative membrane protein